MISSGLKLSEIIAILQQLKKQHGDVECFTGGTDYPEGVSGAAFWREGDGYVKAKSVVIY